MNAIVAGTDELLFSPSVIYLTAAMAERRIVMANVIEIAKALITAYNEKNWSKVKDMLAADAVYDEKGTHRQIQAVGEIIDAWQGWAKTIPNSKATFVREFASGGHRYLRGCVEGR